MGARGAKCPGDRERPPAMAAPGGAGRSRQAPNPRRSSFSVPWTRSWKEEPMWAARPGSGPREAAALLKPGRMSLPHGGTQASKGALTTGQPSPQLKLLRNCRRSQRQRSRPLWAAPLTQPLSNTKPPTAMPAHRLLPRAWDDHAAAQAPVPQPPAAAPTPHQADQPRPPCRQTPHRINGLQAILGLDTMEP